MPDYIVHKAVELSALSTKTQAALQDKRLWIISPKYDGCHAVFCFDNGKHVGTYSRSGETVRSLDHIATDLLALYPLESGRVAICGEAWIVGEEFNVVSGAFRRHAPQYQMQFVPFDIVPFDYNTDTASGPVVLLGQADNRLYPAPYSKRLQSLFRRRSIDRITNVLTPRWASIIDTLDGVMTMAVDIAKENKANTTSFYDGAVLAQGDGRYLVGSGKGGEFIKIKPLLSETVTVTAVVSDIGGKTGKNTCVLCFDLNGVIQKVSTGLTQAQADEYTLHPENIIDQRIEVEAMGLTVNGLLREPRFKGIRNDA